LTVLFERAVKLVILTAVESYTIEDLHIDFTIETSRESKALNSANITVWNLSEATRKNIDENYLALEFHAGYAGKPVLIFSGRIIECKSERSGVDWKTTFQALDGGTEYFDKFYNKAWSAGTPIQSILADVVGTMGLPFEMLPTLIPITYTLYSGAAYSGKCKDVLNEICNTHGLSWSIQRGVIEVTDKNFPPISALASVVILSADTGLIGYPVVAKEDDIEVNKEEKKKGILVKPIAKISFTSLLNPEIRPSRLVMFMLTAPTNVVGIRMKENKKGEKYKGQTYNLTTAGLFIVDTAKYSGSNYESNFYVDGVCNVFSG
jgi:hypothetical protein